MNPGRNPVTLALALAAAWLTTATAAGILIGRALRDTTTTSSCYCCDDGYAPPPTDLDGEIRA